MIGKDMKNYDRRKLQIYLTKFLGTNEIPQKY